MIGDLGIGSWDQPVKEPRPAREVLTVEQLFRLFRRGREDTRWLSSADSQEYLALVSFLIGRSCQHGDSA